MPFQKWRRDLSKIVIATDQRPAPPLPAEVAEWFDVNREANVGAMSIAIATSKLHALNERVRAIKWAPDWATTLISGWSVRLARYTRGPAVPTLSMSGPTLPSKLTVYNLLMIARGPTEPKIKDWTMRENILERLCCDIEEHHLMDTGDDERPDLISFWTWPST